LIQDKFDLTYLHLHYEELRNVYASPDITRVVEPRRMRWTGQAARMEKLLKKIQNFGRKTEGKRPYGVMRVDWTKTSECTLAK